MNLRTKYAVLKATTIALGALSIPWSTFIGFCFGEGRYSTGVVALCLQTAVALIDGYIWFWVLENMRNGLEETGKRNDGLQPVTANFTASNNQSAYQPVCTGGQSDLNCSVCGRALLPNRATFRCQCGSISHAECWEKHVVTSHQLSFILGYVTIDDEFKAKELRLSGEGASS